jgi:MSHA pilin protein MshD
MSVLKYSPQKPQQGFSLIELIAGIVILAMGMTALTAIIYPNATKSIDPVYQVRAAELGQSLLNEMMGKAFDENSKLSGGLLRCDEAGATNCTLAAGLGLDGSESDPDSFDDVDDYKGYNESKELLSNNQNYDALYSGFEFTVDVFYDGNYDGIIDTNRVAKRISIAITTPSGQVFDFAGYKANY